MIVLSYKSPLYSGAGLTSLVQGCTLLAEISPHPRSVNVRAPHVANLFRVHITSSLATRLLLHRFLIGVPLRWQRKPSLVSSAYIPPPHTIVPAGIARNLPQPPFSPRISRVSPFKWFRSRTTHIPPIRRLQPVLYLVPLDHGSRHWTLSS